MNLPAWVESYRGIPYRRRGIGPDAFDCYGLVVTVLRDQFGVDVAALRHARGMRLVARLAAAFDDPGARWAEVDGEPEPGDALLFEGPENVHVGVVVAPGWMLHADERNGVETARFARMPWAALRLGPAFRHRALAAATVT